MIRFSLCCDREHDFDGWFRDNADFDKQKKRGLVTCPVCNSAKVEKALMAPSVQTARKREKVALGMNAEQKQLMGKLKELTDKVKQNADYVGDKFPEEARKIHFGETDARGIYGEASPTEVKELLDDGVGIMPLPNIPDDTN
ncbi:DUF1178 family protein [Mesorhizobium sp. Z1-4]|uniref:DUF1178 family protein n=1 Tax=Mesorhizobium sp. Z1-4 TaxID=2448478 RepID=UPI000FD9A159|nr:DUF1178 family protein [Mesorhizobium sp. Z1-4]